MKTKNIHHLIKLIVVIGASSLFAVSLQAGRGGNGGGQGGGNGGQCPQGFEPGTRMQQDCTYPQDGSGRQNKNSGKKGSGGKGAKDGSGKQSGNGKGARDGTGNPETCPNFGS